MSGDDKKPPEVVDIEAEAPPAAVPETPEAAAAPAPAEPTVESLAAELDKLEKEKKQIYDRLLRTAADFDNYKKRSSREAGEVSERGRKELLKELLPVVDNLERALSHADSDSGEAVLEGVRLVLRQFHGTLEKFGVKSFESAGQPFDPALHEAVSQLETDEQPPGTIVREYQKGYLAGGKLLRPAMVVVAKPRSEETVGDEEAAGPNGKEPEPGAGPNGGDAGKSTGEP